MKTIIFHPLAEQELMDATAHYEAKKLGLGFEYLAEIEHAVTLISRYPETGTKIKGSIRRLVLPRFPYSLLYRFLENDQIRVLAVAHHKRKPQYWVNRG
jgi:toxin ParE1/3/4